MSKPIVQIHMVYYVTGDDEMPILERETPPPIDLCDPPSILDTPVIQETDSAIVKPKTKKPRIGPAFTKREGGRFYGQAVTNLDRKNALKIAKSPNKKPSDSGEGQGGGGTENTSNTSSSNSSDGHMGQGDGGFDVRTIKTEPGSEQVEENGTSNTGKRKADEMISPKIITLQKIVESERKRRSVERTIKKEPASPTASVSAPVLQASDTAQSTPKSTSIPLNFRQMIDSGGKKLVLTTAPNVLTTATTGMFNKIAQLSTPSQHSKPKLILTFSPATTQVTHVTMSAQSQSIIDLNANKKLGMATPPQASPGTSLLNQSGSGSAKGKSLIVTITTCYICRQEFSSYQLLKEHMKTHSEIDKLEVRGNKELNAEGKIACGLCGLECLKKDMNEHFKTHGIAAEEEVKPQLNTSRLDSSSQNSSVTETSINEEELFKLSKVEGIVYSDLKGEETKLSPGKIQCGICNLELLPDKISKHVDNHNRKADRIDVDELFDTENNSCVDDDGKPVLNGAGTPMINKMYKCKKCAYKSDRASRIKEHVRNCFYSDVQYGCKLCGRAYRTKRYMLRHFKSHSENDEWSMAAKSVSPGAKRYTCEKCYYETTRPSRYREHLQLCGVTNDSHECPTCGKLFKIKRYLNKHMKRHIQGKMFACIICSFKVGVCLFI